jgi:aspartyl-tRNA synthetase
VIDQSICDIASNCRNEYVVKVVGQVIARPGTMANDAMNTGAIEIIPSSVEILSKSKELPFQIIDNPATSEEQRMKYRYLDLRRRKVLSNIEFRARMNQWTRTWFSDRGFLEVQTPIFSVSSPE